MLRGKPLKTFTSWPRLTGPSRAKGTSGRDHGYPTLERDHTLVVFDHGLFAVEISCLTSRILSEH